MPPYDYKCRSCDHRWEEFQPITAKATEACPACEQPAAERVIGPGAGILFKGSGFYQTDYRSDGYKKAADADKKASEPKEKKEAKADSKSDTKKKAD